MNAGVRELNRIRLTANTLSVDTLGGKRGIDSESISIPSIDKYGYNTLCGILRSEASCGCMPKKN